VAVVDSAVLAVDSRMPAVVSTVVAGSTAADRTAVAATGNLN
jgi:hypothetical protein